MEVPGSSPGEEAIKQMFYFAVVVFIWHILPESINYLG